MHSFHCHHNYSDRLHHKLAHCISEIPAVHWGDRRRPASTGVDRHAWRKSASLHAGIAARDGGKTRRWRRRRRLCSSPRGERQSNRTHVQRSRGRGYCFRRGEPRARASERAGGRASQQTEAGSGRGSILAAPARSWTSKKPVARRGATAARHGTRHETQPDCVATTCELSYRRRRRDAHVGTIHRPIPPALYRSLRERPRSQRRVGQ